MTAGRRVAMNRRHRSPRERVSRGHAIRWGGLALAALAALVGAGEPTADQTRDASATISSDRPGLGDGAHVVAPGIWQAELGGTIDAALNDEFLVGSSLLRVGFDALELRVFLPSVLIRNQDEFFQLGDLAVGVKVPVDLGGGWRWAATGALTLPTGSDKVSARDPGAASSLIAERSLSETVGLALNAGYGFLFGDVGGGTLSLLVTPTFAIPGRDDLAWYAGYAGFIQEGDDGHWLELGLTRLDGVDRQWDVNAGYDPWNHVWFLGVGVAERTR